MTSSDPQAKAKSAHERLKIEAQHRSRLGEMLMNRHMRGKINTEVSVFDSPGSPLKSPYRQSQSSVLPTSI